VSVCSILFSFYCPNVRAVIPRHPPLPQTLYVVVPRVFCSISAFLLFLDFGSASILPINKPSGSPHCHKKTIVLGRLLTIWSFSIVCTFVPFSWLLADFICEITFFLLWCRLGLGRLNGRPCFLYAHSIADLNGYLYRLTAARPPFLRANNFLVVVGFFFSVAACNKESARGRYGGTFSLHSPYCSVSECALPDGRGIMGRFCTFIMVQKPEAFWT